MDKRAGFWNLLLISSGIAAAVSLLTTASGLSQYLSVLLAWPLAAAVQGGLFGLAWLLASGARRERPLLLALYLMTMPFSVVFSYVMLQSELTERTRPAQTQRQLLDEVRSRHREVGQTLGGALTQADELKVHLGGWLEAEQTIGWAMSTCDGVRQCYLEEVCHRLQDRIAAWERAQGRPYRQGPGKQLIYGLLETEERALDGLHRRLADGVEAWRRDTAALAPGLGNLERLQRFDAALTALPHRDIDAMTCGEAPLAASPDYAAYSRDVADSRERPLYAFEDLIAALEPGRDVTRTDYPTFFAAALALFIDLFVLLVAIGASRLRSVPGPAADPGLGEAETLPI